VENSVTHFEIYGEDPAKLAGFYRDIFGWQVEQMPGVNYWRIQTGSAEPKALHGGLTYRALPDLNGWMLFVNVASLDETVTLAQKLGARNHGSVKLCVVQACNLGIPILAQELKIQPRDSNNH
jgi:predicted enzyme related to lactoylglutathione lyase